MKRDDARTTPAARVERRLPRAESPWTHVDTHGKLEPAEGEWLHTNGAGAYSMSTVALMHTRREHGLLVAPNGNRSDRHSAILSHAEVMVEAHGRVYRLATHRFPGVAPTLGYQLLRAFDQDPLPRWTYSLGRARFERTHCLVRGESALVLGFTWHGAKPAVMTLRPLMAMRPHDELMHEHGGVLQRITLRPGWVEIRPYAELPPVSFQHEGVFVGSPEWWRRFEYSVDAAAGDDAEEDLWTPGLFELQLRPGEPQYVVVSVEAVNPLPPAALVQQVAHVLRAHDPGPTRPLAVRRLFVAAEQYCAEHAPRPIVLSGYPPRRIWLRDTLMTIPGLFLTRGRVADAMEVIGTVVSTMRGGWLPERLDGSAPKPSGRAMWRSVAGSGDRACVDATLWLFETVRALSQWTGADDGFMRDTAFVALKQAFEAIVASPPSSDAWLDDRGLLCVARGALPSTWMDATHGGEAITPRHGAAVEHQALFARACRVVVWFAEQYGETDLAKRATDASEKLTAAFAAHYWNSETNYPFDRIAPSPPRSPSAARGDSDAAVRPNAVLALALEPRLFQPWQANAILKTARDGLLTPRGLRSLAPFESDYRGEFGTTDEARSYTFHQGASWTFLLAPYARASIAAAPEDFEVHADLRHLAEGALDGGPLLGQVAQLSDGDDPFRPQGAPAQAASVAALLWILAAELEL